MSESYKPTESEPSEANFALAAIQASFNRATPHMEPSPDPAPDPHSRIGMYLRFAYQDIHPSESPAASAGDPYMGYTPDQKAAMRAWEAEHPEQTAYYMQHYGDKPPVEPDRPAAVTVKSELLNPVPDAHVVSLTQPTPTSLSA